MPVYDGDLKELQRRAARRTQVQAQLRELETQRSAWRQAGLPHFSTRCWARARKSWTRSGGRLLRRR